MRCHRHQTVPYGSSGLAVGSLSRILFLVWLPTKTVFLTFPLPLKRGCGTQFGSIGTSASHSHVAHRNIAMTEYFIFGRLDRRLAPSKEVDRDQVCDLVREVFPRPTLVFCPTKRNAESVARLLVRHRLPAACILSMLAWAG